MYCAAYFEVWKKLKSGSKMTPRCPRHPWVIFLLCRLFFKPQATDFKATTISQNLLFTVQIHLIHVFNNFLTSLFLINSLMSRTSGSHFQIWRAPWKIAKIKNHSRESLIGQGWVVWWKTQLQKSHATGPIRKNAAIQRH